MKRLVTARRVGRCAAASGDSLSTHFLRHGQFHLLCLLRFKPLRAVSSYLIEKGEQRK